MAKKNKGQPRQASNNTTPAQNSSLKPVVSKVTATIENARSSGVVVDPSMKFDEALADQFSKAIPAQEHDALRAWLEQFATLGKAIKDKIAEANKKQQQLEQEQRSLLEKQDALKKDREVFAKESAELNPKIEEHKAAHSKLIDRERDLEARELDARTGFSCQNEIALKTLKEDIKRLELERDGIRNEIETLEKQLTSSQQEKDSVLYQRELNMKKKSAG